MHMDPRICHEHLAKLLGEEFATLAALEEILEREHAVLLKNDTESLQQSAEARQRRYGALVRIDDERRSLCRSLGYSADLQGLEKLLLWCDPAGALQQRWGECAERAARCRKINDRNGALVAARLTRVQGLLGALTGRGEQAGTYGPNGIAPRAQRPGRVLGAA